MRLLQLFGEKTRDILLSLRVFWRPTLLLAILAHVLLLRTRLPENPAATEVIKPPEEEFVKVTTLVGDGLEASEADDRPDEPEESAEESPRPKPKTRPKPKPEPEPEASAESRATPPPRRRPAPSNDQPDNPPSPKPAPTDDGAGDKGDPDPVPDPGTDQGEDGAGEDGGSGDRGQGDDGGENRRSQGTGILNVLKDRTYSRLTAGGAGVNDPAAVRAQLESFPQVNDVDSADDQAVLCPEQSGENICNPVANGTAFGALRIPQTPSSQAELLMLGDGADAGILGGLRFSGAPLGRLGARGSGTVYHVTQDEGDVEFYLGFVKVFGGGQTFVVLWENNPLE